MKIHIELHTIFLVAIVILAFVFLLPGVETLSTFSLTELSPGQSKEITCDGLILIGQPRSGKVVLYCYAEETPETPTPTLPPTETLEPTNTPMPTPSATLTPEPTGNIYYVAIDGDNDNPGTEEQPFHTINKGVSVLDPGDIVYVKSGTYTEKLYYIPSGTSWDTAVTVAAYPGNIVTIRPDSGTYVLQFANDRYITVDGFILDGANVSHKVIKIQTGSHHIRIQNSEVKESPTSGIHVSGSNSDYNEFINLNVHDNGSDDFDHGLYIETDHNLVEGCTVHHNSGWGIHVYNGYSGQSTDYNIIRNNRVYDNARSGNRGVGIGLYEGKGNIAYNNLIWGNNVGIAVDYNALDTQVYNNTIYANDSYAVRVGNGSADTIVRNNIIYANDSQVRNAGTGTIMDHNLVGIDPRFVDAAAHDFHLQPNSPAINAGVTLSEVPNDFDGTLRPQGSAYDIGAHEYIINP